MVFIPGLDVEGKERCDSLKLAKVLYHLTILFWQKQVGLLCTASLTAEQYCYRCPSLAHVLASGEEENFQGGVDRIDAVVEQLPERAALSCPASGGIRATSAPIP